MSKATKRKHVTREAVDDYFVPEGEEEIVKIVASRGNNLHEVENAAGNRYLVSMPTKFRKNIWVKRGDFVVTEPIAEGNKVQAEIIYILLAKQIKYLKTEKLWPKEFSTTTSSSLECGPDLPTAGDLEEKVNGHAVNGNGHKEDNTENGVDDQTNNSNNNNDSNNSNNNNNNNNTDEDSESESSSDEDIFENPNHRPMYYVDDSSEDDSSEEEEEEYEDSEEERGADMMSAMNNSAEYQLQEGIAKVKLK